MKIRRFSLQREYAITCKLFLPETAQVRLLRMPGADHRFKNPGEIEAIVAATRHFLDL